MNLALEVIDWTLFCLGAIVGFYIFAEICWRMFCAAFKLLDKILNDYEY